MNTALHNPALVTPKDLRLFGLIWAVIWVLLSLRPLLHQQPVSLTFIGIAAGFVLVALLVPVLLKPLYQMWTKFGHVMGRINTRILLFLLFFGLITPMAVCMRCLGHDPLQRRWDPQVPSYWKTRTQQPSSMKYAG